MQAFAENVSIIDGPSVRDMGFMFTTRMTVVRLSDGSLWVNSPVPVPFDGLKRIAELGHCQIPCGRDPKACLAADSVACAVPRSTAMGSTNHPIYPEERAPARHGNPGGRAAQGWADDLDQLAFKGNPLIEEVLFFHKESHTVIVDDLIQIHPIVKGRPFRNALLKLAGVASPHGGVALDIRLSFKNRNLARRSLEKLLSWDFDKLIIAHGACIEKDAKTYVERAFRWLAR